MENQHRQLAAILFTDIVGYTALMQENEQKAVGLIKHYNAALNETVKLHNGKILNYYGDGSLCSFPSVKEAMSCAVELQKELQTEPKVPLRIGLHVGEVFFENEKALGDGVNVASRIQSLGQENTIFFSKEIFDKIRNQPEFKSVSIGFFEFKNVEQPMEVFALANEGLNIPKRETLEGKLKTNLSKNNKTARRKIFIAASLVFLLVAGFFIYSIFLKKPGFTGKEKSIAVLPFINMSNDKENEYFSDGMTEEITTQLSKIADLNVISTASTILYKGSKKTIKEIASELGVSVLLKGTVRREGNEVRISPQLIDANTQKNIWAETYDREFKEIFAIQSEVAQEIAHQLKAKLTKEEKNRIEKLSTNNPEAYKFYLQGYLLHTNYYETRKPEYYEKSRSMFEKALSLDSNYALAHAGIADLYNTYSNTDSQIIYLQIKEIDKAWKIDSTNDYVNFVKATIEQTPLGNKENAFKYFKKAIEINRNNPDNPWGLGNLLAFDFGMYDEAKLLFERTTKLDPLTASNFVFLGLCNYAIGNYEDAIKNYETAIRLEPDYISALDALAYLYAWMGRLDKSKKMIERSFKLKPSITGHSTSRVAYVFVKMGNKKKALELAPRDWGVLLALGMKEEAIKAMPYYNDTDNRTKTEYLIFKSQKDTKEFEPIRNDPRFLKIFERGRKIYEENKQKYSVMDIINSFSSLTP